MPILPGLNGESDVDVIKRAFKSFSKDDMGTYAAALAYQTLFSIFPFLLFLIAMLGFLDVPQFFDWMLEQAQSAFPQDVFNRFETILNEVRNNSAGGLLSFGVIAALWSASGGMRALMNALNVAYGVEETRPLWKKYALSVGYTLATAILLMVSAALMLLGPDGIEWLADQIGLGDLFVTLWTWLRFPVLIILLIIVCALLYYAAPNIKQPFKLITPGAVIAVLVWVLASIAFSIYVSNFGNYSATYGSLGGVIIGLTYFFMSAAVLLLGAEINAEVYRAEFGPPVPADKADAQAQANRHTGPTGRDQLLLDRPTSG
jgi:membrane protein